MKKRDPKFTVSILVILVMVILMIGGATSGLAKGPITISFPTYRVGVQNSAPVIKQLLDEFHKKYGKEINVAIEEIPSDTTYTDKMKILAASGELPDVVEAKTGLIEVLSKSGQAVDMMKYLNADPAWKAEIGVPAIQANTREGKLTSVCYSSLLVGYFYNKDYFQKVGIKPAATWDEFMSNCEKLKAAGITPLALMTGENAWTTNLILSAIVGSSGNEGNKFMNTRHPKNFETPEFIEGLKKVQIMLQKYTTSDAVGAVYASAANNFMQGKAAMIANGPWMIPDMARVEGLLGKVGVASYPGSGVFVVFENGFAVCSKDKEHQDAAAKFVKFLTNAHAQQIWLEKLNVMPMTSKVKIPAQYKKANPLVSDLINAGLKAKYNYAFIDAICYPNVIDAFQRLYPEIAFNKETPEGMAKKLSELAAKNQD